MLVMCGNIKQFSQFLCLNTFNWKVVDGFKRLGPIVITI